MKTGDEGPRWWRRAVKKLDARVRLETFVCWHCGRARRGDQMPMVWGHGVETVGVVESIGLPVCEDCPQPDEDSPAPKVPLPIFRYENYAWSRVQ